MSFSQPHPCLRHEHTPATALAGFPPLCPGRFALLATLTPS